MGPRSLSIAPAVVATGLASVGDLPVDKVGATYHGRNTGANMVARVARRKPPATFMQAIVVRRDLRMIVRQLLPYIAQAIVAPLAQRDPDFGSVPLAQAEQPWLEGDFQVRFFCVHSERALFEVFDSAKQREIAAHVIYKSRELPTDSVRTAVCCAVGPALTQQIVAVTGRLVTW